MSKPRSLTIVDYRSIALDKGIECFCGNPARYAVRLHGQGAVPICISCLCDRLQMPGQSLQIRENELWQFFDSTHRGELQVIRQISDHGVVMHYVAIVDNTPDPEEPIYLLGGKYGANKLKKAVDMLNAFAADNSFQWSELITERTEHRMWNAARAYVATVQKELFK